MSLLSDESRIQMLEEKVDTLNTVVGNLLASIDNLSERIKALEKKVSE